MPFNVAPCACCWAGTCGASSKQDLGLVLMPEKTLVLSKIHNNHRLMMVHEINEYRWLRTQLCYWWRSSGGEGGAKPNQTRLEALDHSHGRRKLAKIMKTRLTIYQASLKDSAK